MVMKSYFVIFVLLLVVTLNGCGSVYCSTPYILHKGECCLDKNKDGECDTGDEEILEEDYGFNLVLPREKVQEKKEDEKKTLTKTKEGVLLKINQDDDPYLGNKDSEVILIEFGDYVDKNTQRFNEEVLPEIIKKYGDKIKYVFRNYPSLTNRQSMLAAEASECAGAQGKFWIYHDKLLEEVYHLTDSSIYIYAEELGLDLAAFKNCMSNHQFYEEVLKDREEGAEYGVPMTPTFFLNNERIAGFKKFDTFEKVLEDALFEQIKLERGKTISATSTGKSYIILEGEAALDNSVKVSPYSNNLDFIDADFSVSATDITKEDSIKSEDKAELKAKFKVKEFESFQENEYEIVLTELITEGVEHTYYGGVGIDVLINGRSSVGTKYLPSSKAYLTLWGKSNIYKNGDLISQGEFTHFLLTTPIRNENNKIMQRDVDEGFEAYLLLTGKYGGDYITETEQGFIYLYWKNLDLREE